MIKIFEESTIVVPAPVFLMSEPPTQKIVEFKMSRTSVPLKCVSSSLQSSSRRAQDIHREWWLQIFA
jgi:hypothetical protein